jgi:hypothetical protein
MTVALPCNQWLRERASRLLRRTLPLLFTEYKTSPHMRFLNRCGWPWNSSVLWCLHLEGQDLPWRWRHHETSKPVTIYTVTLRHISEHSDLYNRTPRVRPTVTLRQRLNSPLKSQTIRRPNGEFPNISPAARHFKQWRGYVLYIQDYHNGVVEGSNGAKLLGEYFPDFSNDPNSFTPRPRSPKI